MQTGTIKQQEFASPYRLMERREFLRFAGYGAMASLIGSVGLLDGCPVNGRGVGAGKHNSGEGIFTAGNDFNPDVEIALQAIVSEASLLPDRKTRVWTYRGQVLRGDASALEVVPNSYLGPIMHLRRGQKVRIQFTNNLPEASIIHWHGLHVPAAMDGHPRFVVGSGKTFVYEFEVRNRAGTYWYHAHPHDRTGAQIYRGLAGVLIVSDDEESKAGLPTGEFDIPLVIQDRTFDDDNQLVHLQGGMMSRMVGFLGDRTLVNGHADFTLPFATRVYRLRLLNASNSRIYKLAWSDGQSLTVIGTDGGLLEKPLKRSYVTLAPAERVELIADFRNYPVGSELELRSLEFAGADNGMMGGMGMMGRGGMMGSQSPPNGVPLTVLKVKVTRKEPETSVLPEKLSTVSRHKLQDAVNRSYPRGFRLSMQRMNWLINGRTFQMEEAAADETVKMNTLEAWEFVNQTSGMGMMGRMSMAHPMHIHAGQFQVIERQIAPEFADGWETVRRGYVDEGWKDTVLVMPGERVRLLLRFEDYPGLFLYHCHNLEHEDMGMMRNYLVVE
jgi:FtsP/CotA-like multicopper oxidase with cupredoxin domain